MQSVLLHLFGLTAMELKFCLLLLYIITFLCNLLILDERGVSEFLQT